MATVLQSASDSTNPVAHIDLLAVSGSRPRPAKRCAQSQLPLTPAAQHGRPGRWKAALLAADVTKLNPAVASQSTNEIASLYTVPVVPDQQPAAGGLRLSCFNPRPPQCSLSTCNNLQHDKPPVRQSRLALPGSGPRRFLDFTQHHPNRPTAHPRTINSLLYFVPALSSKLNQAGQLAVHRHCPPALFAGSTLGLFSCVRPLFVSETNNRPSAYPFVREDKTA